MKILITRSFDQSRRFSERLVKKFDNKLDISISPIIKIKPLYLNVELNSFDGIIFTSENAIKVCKKIDISSDKKIFCVGRQTKKMAEKNGLKVSNTGKDTASLIKLLLTIKIKTRLLYLCGKNISVDLSKAFSSSDTVSVCTKAIYDQTPLKLTLNAINILSQKKPVLVPIFSERSGHILSRQFTKKMTSPRIALCFSKQIANSLVNYEYDKVLISPYPDIENLIALIEEFI
ncbi:MAG: uroporphyrinogen-III synthase [Paracoccaceae bacterium]|jgi:uroporphyrinogen-III synthase|tara:strand:+ start:437 stop:1132 length:696 start_codon:yes stop_codon:yes gene_type:complete